MHPLEVPVFSPPSASLAIAAGAHRIELNRAGSYPQGGLTPSLADLEALSGSSPVPLRVMIRPRGPPPADEEGAPDFVYSDDEFGEMKAAVCAFRDSGLLRRERGDGFVFGVLRAAGAAVVVDVERNRELVGLAGGLPCVFHRAFVCLHGPWEAPGFLCCAPFLNPLPSSSPIPSFCPRACLRRASMRRELWPVRVRS